MHAAVGMAMHQRRTSALFPSPATWKSQSACESSVHSPFDRQRGDTLVKLRLHWDDTGVIPEGFSGGSRRGFHAQTPHHCTLLSSHLEIPPVAHVSAFTIPRNINSRSSYRSLSNAICATRNCPVHLRPENLLV